MAGKTPATIDLSIIRGDDFSLPFQIVTCDEINPSSSPTDILYAPTVIDGVTWTPLNLTTCNVMSQIRKSTAIAEVLAMSFTITLTNAAIGLYTMSLTNTQTSQLAMNDQVSYRYDTQVVTADGKITTYVIGAVNITLDVTR